MIARRSEVTNRKSCAGTRRHVLYAFCACAAMLAGCKPADGVGTSDASAYSFSDIRGLSVNLLYGSASDAAVGTYARQNLPAIASLYQQKLDAFAATEYPKAAGIQEQPEWAACRSAFDETGALAKQQGTSAEDIEKRGRDLQARLKACRKAAEAWAAEANSVGGATRKMASGALLVVANAMAAGGATASGYLVGQEAGALMSIDNPQ